MINPNDPRAGDCIVCGPDCGSPIVLTATTDPGPAGTAKAVSVR